MKLERLTKSSIQKYLECPHLFLLIREKQAEGGEKGGGRWGGASDSLRIGNAVHYVSQLWLQGKIKEAKKELVRLLGEPHLVKQAQSMLNSLDRLLQFDKPVAQERERVVKIEGLPECRVRFDVLIEGKDTVKVKEIKTGWSVYGQRETEESFEARWYKLMLDRLYPDKIDKQIQYIYLRTETIVGVKPEPLKIDYLELLVKAMEEGPYPPRFSRCPGCNFAIRCNVGVEGQGEQAIAKRYLYHHGKAQAFKDMLKAMVRDKQIRVDNWGFYWATVSYRKIKNNKELWRMIKDAGEYVKPDMSDLEKKIPSVIHTAIREGVIEQKTYRKFEIVRISG